MRVRASDNAISRNEMLDIAARLLRLPDGLPRRLRASSVAEGSGVTLTGNMHSIDTHYAQR
jgi:hypothetical protein